MAYQSSPAPDAPVMGVRSESTAAGPARGLPPDGTTFSLLVFILRATWRQQAVLVGATLASLPFYYMSLEIAKTVINRVLLAGSAEEVVTLEMFGLDVHTAPARVPSRTSLQIGAAPGGCQRSGPTGGGA